ncbi:MAG: Gfo/Idh/MocA family oxidoreductase [Atopobiaceae bacterium]|nr:Gfo/Idh/MocA family oxidoreductase [Atopobiaceae bacterium]
MKPLRVATIGTGIVVDWFLDAVSQTEGIELVGAYSRSLEKARAWGEPRGARLFFDDLDELAACAEIDAVYVASPNALHIPNANVMLEAGKHVLAEKALASNAREAAEAFALAHEKGVVLMEAMRNVHGPVFDTIRDALPQLGEVRSATLRFSKVSSRVPALMAGRLTNTFDPCMSGGGLMDIGVYCVSAMTALWGAPQRVAAMGTTFDVSTIGGDPRWPLVELGGEALCDYGDFVVNLSWGKVGDNHVPSQIMGTEATLVIDSISTPQHVEVVRPAQTDGGYGSGAGEATLLGFPMDGSLMTAEVADFVTACSGSSAGQELAQRYERISLDALSVMDHIRQQIGTRFPADGPLAQ